MSRLVKLPSSDGEPKKFTPAPPLQGSESINFVQFNTLLNAVNAYMAFLANAKPEDYQGGAMDGGVKAAAEATFIQLCNRVDSMVADNQRWSMMQQQSLADSMLNLHAENRALMQEQRAAVAIMQSPHVRFHPFLMRLDTGNWAAILGDPKSETTSVVGIGASPEDALRDFDARFTGQQQKIYEKQTGPKMDASGGDVSPEQPGTVDTPADSGKARKKTGRRVGKKPPVGRRRHRKAKPAGG